MSAFDTNTGPGFGGLRSLEASMEVGLAAAALGFTLAIWLLSSSGPTAQQAMRDAATGQDGVRHVTLATVLVRGTRPR